MIVGRNGSAVVISAETAHYLETLPDVRKLRMRTRGRLPHVAQELLEIREAAMSYVPHPALPEAEVPFPPPATGSEQWMTPAQVADLTGMSDRAVRMACDKGRLKAEKPDGRWRIRRDAFENWQAARAA